MEELSRLAESAGAEVVASVVQERSARTPAFTSGKAKSKRSGRSPGRWAPVF